MHLYDLWIAFFDAIRVLNTKYLHVLATGICNILKVLNVYKHLCNDGTHVDIDKKFNSKEKQILIGHFVMHNSLKVNSKVRHYYNIESTLLRYVLPSALYN